MPSDSSVFELEAGSGNEDDLPVIDTIKRDGGSPKVSGGICGRDRVDGSWPSEGNIPTIPSPNDRGCPEGLSEESPTIVKPSIASESTIPETRSS